jgi:hypothetical protein
VNAVTDLRFTAGMYTKPSVIFHLASNYFKSTAASFGRPKVKYRALRQIIKNYQNWQLILICMTFNIPLQLID